MKPDNLEILDLSDADPMVQRAMIRFVIMMAEADRAKLVAARVRRSSR